MRLVKVVSPGSVGKSIVKVIVEERYHQINDFSLSEQSGEWGAFHDCPTNALDVVNTRNGGGGGIAIY